MKTVLLTPASAAWRDTIGRVRHDFYHLPEYVAVSAGPDGGDPCAVLVSDAERSLLLPLVLRPVENDLRDAVSPYGYPAPLVAGSDDVAFQRDALLAVVESLRQKGVVSVFVRAHPLLRPELPDGVGTVVRHGDCVCVDITKPLEVQWRETRRNHRQQIRRSTKAGYEVTFDDWGRYDAFKTLYRSTMALRAADEYYFFSDAYFDDLRAALGERIHLATVILEGHTVAAAVFVETDGTVQMHLTGSDEAHAAHQPMKLLFHKIRTWATERDDRWLHLGGGRGGTEDSLFHFKAGFSPLRVPYRTLRVVVRPGDYARLVRERDRSLDPGDMQGPFPLYRAISH